jgi:hypothetical protein
MYELSVELFRDNHMIRIVSKIVQKHPFNRKLSLKLFLKLFRDDHAIDSKKSLIYTCHDHTIRSKNSPKIHLSNTEKKKTLMNYK